MHALPHEPQAHERDVSVEPEHSTWLQVAAMAPSAERRSGGSGACGLCRLCRCWCWWLGTIEADWRCLQVAAMGDADAEMSPPRQKLNPHMRNLIVGGLSGCISRTAVSPLERLKILYQVQYMALRDQAIQTDKYPGMVSSLRLIWREEGFRGFFKGNGANCIRVFPYIGLQFMCFSRYKDMALERGFLAQPGDQAGTLNSMQKLIVGAAAGTTSVIFTYPLDVARGRLTAQGGVTATQYRGIFHTLTSMVKAEGFKSIYRGMVPNLIGVAPYVGVNYLVFESLKEIAPRQENGEVSATMLMVCGGIAGTTGQTVAYPMDLLRRRFQMRSQRYKGVVHAIQTIVREEGIVGLYKGYIPNFVKVVPTIAIMFVSNDVIKRWLADRDL
eukprot:m.47574 g.47574  ORF g.47574 m.47574 type:complete len:386 (+) comp6363_c0_seq2:92-1249(+)